MNIQRIKRYILYFAISLLSVYFFSVIVSVIFGISISGHRGRKIGLIKIEGIIVSSSSFIDQLKKVRENDSINAVVIRIDSPGGGVAPSQEIYKEIMKFKQKTRKKVVVSMANTAASGGYYIACAADKIVANPGTLTGSIGVITKFPNLKVLFEKIGYKEQTVKSGKFKDIGSHSRELTQEEKKLLQDIVDDIHQQFIESVAESRNIEIESIKKIADGRIFTGRQAMEFNLIDSLGSLEDAIDLAAKLAGISGKPKIISLKKEPSIFETFKDFIGQRFGINPFNWSPIKLQYIMY